jgi:hypothetical protein
MNTTNNTNTNYRGTNRIEVYSRISSSDSRRTASSNDFEIRSLYNNSFSFGSSDNGYVHLSNIIRFNKNYDFKVKIIDTNNSNI